MEQRNLSRRRLAPGYAKNGLTNSGGMSGIFAQLKITDPTAVASTPIARDVHLVTVPIGFRQLLEYVDRVWDTIEAIGTRPFASLNSPVNKNLFKNANVGGGQDILCSEGPH